MQRRLFFLTLLAARVAAAAPTLVSSFEDPEGDATGTGTYVYPGDSEFTDGDFDLRRFAVLNDGDEVVFEVTLGAPIRRPAVTQRTSQSEIPLTSGIYLQNIDIYVDTDRAAPGFSACIPGRRVAFDGTWKTAVVLTPQPGPARSISADALGREASSRIFFIEHIGARGRTLIARVPALQLGGPARKSWGYSVQVSGADWERSFSVLDRVRSTREANAFTMPVLPQREAWAFGGAPERGSPPRVVDVLLPAGVDQKAVLGSFSPETGAFARVPFVYGEPPLPAHEAAAGEGRASGAAVSAHADGAAGSAHADGAAQGSGAQPGAGQPGRLQPGGAAAPAAAAAPRARGPELTVQYVAGNMISLAGPSAGLAPMQFGRVLDKDGQLIARVVIVQVLDSGLVVSAVEHGELIKRGARVRFDPPPPSP